MRIKKGVVKAGLGCLAFWAACFAFAWWCAQYS